MEKEGVNNEVKKIENNEVKEGWKVINKNFYDLHIEGSKWEPAQNIMKKFLENLEMAASAHGLIIRNIKTSQNPRNAWGDDCGYHVCYEVAEPSKLLSKEEILNNS